MMKTRNRTLIVWMRRTQSKLRRTVDRVEIVDRDLEAVAAVVDVVVVAAGVDTMVVEVTADAAAMAVTEVMAGTGSLIVDVLIVDFRLRAGRMPGF